MLEEFKPQKYLIAFFPPFNAGYCFERPPEENAQSYVQVDETRLSEEKDHHCHPYFVIWNAYPKFAKYAKSGELTPAQSLVFEELEAIMSIWKRYYALARASAGATQSQGDEDLRDMVHQDQFNRDSDPGDSSSGSEASKEHSDLSGTNASQASFTEEPEHETDRRSAPVRTRTWSRIREWLGTVPHGLASEHLFGRTIKWRTNESSRPPLEPLKKRVQWSNPPDTTKFSSADWAMYLMGAYLQRRLLPDELVG
jgi:hypothetical protein